MHLKLKDFTKELEIIYRDEYLVAVNKPPGLLVHRTKLSNEKESFALQMVRNQIEQHVYPVHRLDRKTSGVLLFALDKDIHRQMQLKFSLCEVDKRYLAIVRGYCEGEGIIDYPIRKENGVMVDAITMYKNIAKVEIDFQIGPHRTSRYSLVKVFPKTGRMHQIRKHFRHIDHPIIGDRPHGCNKQNKFFKEEFDLMTMLLHAYQLRFHHPVRGKPINLKAQLHIEFDRMIKVLCFKKPDLSELCKFDG